MLLVGQGLRSRFRYACLQLLARNGFFVQQLRGSFMQDILLCTQDGRDPRVLLVNDPANLTVYLARCLFAVVTWCRWLASLEE